MAQSTSEDTAIGDRGGRVTARVPIAIVMSTFGSGGTERQMIELIRRLDRRHWDVRVACLRTEGAWFERVAAAADWTAFPVRSFKRVHVLRQLRAFARWCRTNQFAIVHAVDITANLFALPAAAMAGVPVRIGTRREINPGRKPLALVGQRAAYGCAHAVVANSRAVAERLRLERVPARKVSVVANGLDVGAFAPRRLEPPLRRVVMLANLRPEKGHDVLIDAAPRVLAAYPDARFQLVGGGPERDRLVARATARGVAHAVSFVGHSEAVPDRLAEADLLVLPSRSEAFPNAVLEAMAAGLPVVASDVGGIPEMIEHGRTGLLVPPGEPRALADAIAAVMGDGTMGIRLGAAARALVEAHYSFEGMIASFERIYRTQLARAATKTVVPALFRSTTRWHVAASPVRDLAAHAPRVRRAAKIFYW